MKRVIEIILFLAFLLVPSDIPAAENRERKCDMNDFPGRQQMLQELFTHLDPEQMGVKYREAVKTGETNALVKAAAEYFRSRPARKYSVYFLEKRRIIS